jgi:signal peptidase I
MTSLQKHAQELQLKYSQRRAEFKESIDDMSALTPWGTAKLRKKGLEMLAQADAIAQEIAESLTGTAEGFRSQVALGKQCRRMKKAYKMLNEFVKPLWRQWAEAIAQAVFLAIILRNFIFGLYHVPTGSAEKNILVGDRIWGNKLAYYYDDVKRGDLVIFDDPTFKFDRSSTVNYYWQRYFGVPIPLLGLSTGPSNWVKRVIAVAGDTIEGRVEDGKTTVYLNGKKLEEAYVNRLPLIHVERMSGLIPFSSFGPFAIPEFLRYKPAYARYTHDPSVSLSEQPYYKIAEEEVIKNPLTGEPIFDYPFTPSLRDSHGGSIDEFGPIVVPEGKYWVMGDSRKNSADSRVWLFLDKSLVHGRASMILYSLDSEEAFWGIDLIKHPVNFWTRIVRWSRFFTIFPKTEIK